MYKVLLLKKVPWVWLEWEIKEVSDWYAQNFLFKKWLAIQIDDKKEKEIIEKKKKTEEKRRNLVEKKHEHVALLNYKTISFTMKAKENWHVFGSIWEKEIIDKIKTEFHLELERKHIDMWKDWHIKNIWKRDVYIKFSPKDIAKIIVEIKNA